MIRSQVPRQAANKSGKSFGLAYVSAPNLFERELKCLLREILRQRLVPCSAIENNQHAQAVLLNQLAFGSLSPARMRATSSPECAASTMTPGYFHSPCRVNPAQ